MFKYTRASLDKIGEELKLISHLYTIIMQVIMLAYFTFALVLPKGYVAVNIIGIAVTAFYLGFYLITHYSEKKASDKSRLIVKKVVKYIKLTLSAFTLATVMYSAIMATSALDGAVTPFTLITTPIMIVVWVLQIAVELLTVYTTSRINIFTDGLKMDLEPVVNPAIKAENAFRRFFKEEEKSELSVDEKTRDELKKRAEEKSEAKKEETKEKWERRGEVLVERIKESGDALAEKLKDGGEAIADKLKNVFKKNGEGESDDSGDPKPEPKGEEE